MGGMRSVTVGGLQNVSVGANLSEKVGRNRTEETGKDPYELRRETLREKCMRAVRAAVMKFKEWRQ